MVGRLRSVHRRSVAAASPSRRVQSQVAAVALQIDRRPAWSSSISESEKDRRCRLKPRGRFDFQRPPPGGSLRPLTVERHLFLAERRPVRSTPGCREAFFPALCCSSEFFLSGSAPHPSNSAKASFCQLRFGPAKRLAD